MTTTTNNDNHLHRSFMAVEHMLKDMLHLEQYVESVIDYTSKYSNFSAICYAPENLVGKCARYPLYGDFPETYMLRSYGKWWKQSETSQMHYMPQDVDPLDAEDYITLRFESAVVPRNVRVYETYNPGAIVRIWGRNSSFSSSINTWQLLWEDGSGHSLESLCPCEPRLFHPPLRLVNFLVNELRLEINQSHLRYFTALDAVLLAGYQPMSSLQLQLLQNQFYKWFNCLEDDSRATVIRVDRTDEDADDDEFDLFAKLPYEIILHIFQYLDLKALSQCAQVNKMWHTATCDPILYHNLCLKKYWHKVTSDTLRYFMNRCHGLKKLDLSWCGDDGDPQQFGGVLQQLLHNCGQNLTHLSLCHCPGLSDLTTNAGILQELWLCPDLLEIRLKNFKLPSTAFSTAHLLGQLTKLVTLDLTSTSIVDDDLIEILKSNPNLKHLVLDFCNALTNLDQVVATVSEHNRKLIAWSSWYTRSLTSNGATLFANCTNLRELDLGWCVSSSNAPAGDCLERIATGCKDLRRLILSGWRSINNRQLLPIIVSCSELIQLDLLGIKSLTGDICESALKCLPQLRLLEISFCDSISSQDVKMWKREYPHVTIQRSCSFNGNNEIIVL